ncbi:aspartate kinase [SAR86 cluster bacterium]|nr:aspartate kinase [SAR86 cluster bacterium]MDC3006552.1 aspartate kinase [SAR86 cluster bacterium]MDC3012615.1 aspartate kinase [SAR86 cluster bacterium]
MNNLIVQKFGGTSIANTDRFQAVADLVVDSINSGTNVAVVVSAMAGETQRLINLAKELQESPDPREYDALVSSGEQVSAALLAIALKERNFLSKSYTAHQLGLVTDNSHGRARINSIDTSALEKDIELGVVPVITGFQGVNSSGDITTLGRGGSDTTAVALAVALKADECQIYTDVDGVYTTDPNVYKKAKKIEKICFEEMLELSSLGAKVLQIRSVEFASKYEMPIRVLSSFNSTGGTLITKEESSLESAVISGITCTDDDSKLILRDVPDTPGIAAKILSPISDAGIDIDVIVQNVGSDKLTDFTFTVKNEHSDKAAKILNDLVQTLGGGEIELVKDVSKVSVVGVGMKSHAGVAAQMFKALAEKQINIDMISTSEIKISVVVSKDKSKAAVMALHDEFELDK